MDKEKTNPKQYNATVISRWEPSDGHLMLRLQPDAGAPDFKPGQFTVLGLQGRAPRCADAVPDAPPPPAPDELLRRAYSIASSPLDRESLEFYVALVPAGRLTPRLFTLEPGSRLFVSPRASGKFVLDGVAEDAHVLLVSTGTGLAPYMSMLRSLPAGGDSRRYTVLHGARTSRDHGYAGELRAIARLCPTVVYLPTITRPETDPFFRGPIGRIPKLLSDGVVEEHRGLDLDPENTCVLLCGNPNMVTDVLSMLEARGFTLHTPKAPGNVRIEKYF